MPMKGVLGCKGKFKNEKELCVFKKFKTKKL